MGLFGSDNVVGIDLGYASIKAVGLKMGKKPVVTGCAMATVEPKSLQKEGLENPEEAAEALKSALKEAAPHKITGSTAYVSVNESAVFRKILEVPASVPDADLPSVIQSGIVEFLPDDIDALELDFQPLTSQGDTCSVMVVAVSKKSIEQYLKLCAMAGLSVQAIDPKPSALVRSVIGLKQTEPVALVDVGSEITTLSLCVDKAVWVAGTVNQGGNIIKDMATGTIDETKKEEKLKRLVGSIADELEHVVKFYANRSSGEGRPSVPQIQLCGGGSMIQGLDTLLATETGYKVSIANPIVPVPGNFDRKFLGALGSALYPFFEKA